ncbi:organic solute transporter Ostalpha-domain-containing protein [Tricharina praecox]|uniref:organic solute transporter Ostalpha-domain-containing protein n=1 Tax=Tricharina praecox TaxID=43433 RepID=UPI00221FD749|nr:organic solute transporter Ostalpha-domain-containing protein [Tricharina praecox]KAI5857952.1 organic solute transporter Ostalpha-domain-containing protein [Tricharina praecox]
MVVCNSTLSETHWDVEPVAGPLTFHKLGWIICIACTLISTAFSLYLIYKHASNYTNRNEQRQIIRILFMVPIYSVTTMFSYVWYWHAVYWQVARDCYEAFAIASFFTLMCFFIAPDLRRQKEYFATMVVNPWPWPASWINKCASGKMRQPRSGLTWFNIVWICIFQYCFIRVATTIIATATQATGHYCEDSAHPAFAHFWMVFFNCIAVTIAMYMLIAFYMNLKTALAPNRPLLKLLCIKLVIFFCFWQMVVFDLLTSANIVKPSKKISPGDISIGFNALLVCFEMIIFSILHLFAFPYAPYQVASPEAAPGAFPVDTPGTSAWKAIVDAFNPFDIIKAFLRGMKWCLVGVRKRHEHAEKVAARKESNHDSLTSHAAPPASYPSSRPTDHPTGLGVYAQYSSDNGGLMVEHPTPNDQEYVQDQDIPTHGIVIGATERTSYVSAPAPVPVPEPDIRQHPAFSPAVSPVSRTNVSPIYPTAPQYPHTVSPLYPIASQPADPGLAARRPGAPNHMLPYPENDAIRMPSINQHTPSPNESQELLEQHPAFRHSWRHPSLRGGEVGSPTAPEVGYSYEYSDSMRNEEGVYQGPNPRRTREGHVDETGGLYL